MYGAFKNVHLTETEFNTAIKIARNKINQSSLIAIRDDPDDQKGLTLTPAHLKLGKALISLPSKFDAVQDMKKVNVLSRWD